jgi:hypothetical protein
VCPSKHFISWRMLSSGTFRSNVSPPSSEEAIRSSETWVYTISTRRHIPEDGIIHRRRRENLKTYTFISSSVQKPNSSSCSAIFVPWTGRTVWPHNTVVVMW